MLGGFEKKPKVANLDGFHCNYTETNVRRIGLDGVGRIQIALKWCLSKGISKSEINC
jgi:hypothetical protein